MYVYLVNKVESMFLFGTCKFLTFEVFSLKRYIVIQVHIILCHVSKAFKKRLRIAWGLLACKQTSLNLSHTMATLNTIYSAIYVRWLIIQGEQQILAHQSV